METKSCLYANGLEKWLVLILHTDMANWKADNGSLVYGKMVNEFGKLSNEM